MSQPLTPEALVHDLVQAGDPRLSPDGRHIVFTLTTIDRRTGRTTSHLWLCDRDGGDRRQLTRAEARDASPRWSPDGRQIAFVSDRVDKSGLFVLPLDGGEPREIVRHRQAIQHPAWSPDGAALAYTVQLDPANPAETAPPPDAAPPVRVTRRLDYKHDGRGYLGDARQQVMVVDLATGGRRQVTTAPFDHAWPCWSPDGRWLAAQRLTHNTLQSQLLLVALEGGEERLIGAERGVVELWAWAPGGDRLLYAADPEFPWQTDFFLHDLVTGQSQRLTADLACLPASAYPGPLPSPPVWLDERQVFFHALRAGRSGLYTLDTATGEVALVAEWTARHVGLSLDASHRYAVQGHAGPNATGEIALYDRETGATRVITERNAALLRARPPARVERFTVERDGAATDAWLLLPPDFDPGRRYPLLLDVHGGPHNLYGDHFSPLQQCLATHGFLVVYANPRGSGSYGRDFARQVVRDWGGEDYLDLLAVVDAALTRPYVDPERVGIYGFSYGGYMVAWAIGQTGRFRAAMCGAPVFDLESFYGTSDIGHLFGDQEFGGPPHADPAWHAAHSPSTFAHRARTPTLILHGEADERCPIGQGEQMFVALKLAGCEVEFARYPGGAHGFPGAGPPAHRVDYMARTLRWFQRHLMPPGA